jgi:hypothetical protein
MLFFDVPFDFVTLHRCKTIWTAVYVISLKVLKTSDSSFDLLQLLIVCLQA